MNKQGGGKFEGKHADLTEKILGAFFQVHTELGYGFSGQVYGNALAIILQGLEMTVEQQGPLKMYFREQLVGRYFADVPVNNRILLELKAAERLNADHAAQLLT